MNGGAPAVVGSVWLNADTLGAFENDLTILKIQLGNVFFRGVTTRNCALQPKKKIFQIKNFSDDETIFNNVVGWKQNALASITSS